MFFDNLKVHTSNDVMERLEELSIPYVLSPTYSPDFNGIESVFSIFKNKMKRLRLKALVHDYEVDLQKEILYEFY